MNKLYNFLLLLTVVSVSKMAKCQAPATTCATATEMTVPTVVNEYCSNLEEGMVKQGQFTFGSNYGTNGKIGWYKFTVPKGLGIKGVMLYMPFSLLSFEFKCAIGQSIQGVKIYKGTDCGNLTLLTSKSVANCTNSLGGNFVPAYNAPAVIDGLEEGATYYIAIEASYNEPTVFDVGIKWLPYVFHNYDCNTKETIHSLPFKGCTITDNADIFQYPQIPWQSICTLWGSSGGQVFNPNYYTLIPSADTFTITATVDNTMPTNNTFFIFKDCNHVGDYSVDPVTQKYKYYYGCANTGIANNTPATIHVSNAVMGEPLILVAAAQYVGPENYPAGALSIFEINGTGILLPLSVNNFEAFYNKTEQNVHLSWQMQSSANLSNFIVEKSIDGKNFKANGQVKSKAGNNAYSFIDQNQPTTKTFYRLKLMDADGKCSYSKLAVINLSTKMDVQLFPNPANNRVNIYLQSANTDVADVWLINTAGKRMLEQKYSIVVGFNTLIMNTINLPKGVYFVKVKMPKSTSDFVGRVVIN